jgi:hypothetical protein
MAFTRVRLDNQLWNQFAFFSSGGTDGGLSETIIGGDASETEHFYIKEVRLHLSVAFVSVEDFIIKLSEAIQGSAYNLILRSQAMLTVKDYQWIPDTGEEKGLLFVSGDTLDIFMSMKSATNVWGLTVLGWAIAS